MKYTDWKNLTDEERKSMHWKHHPRIRVATIFSILFAVVFAVVLLRIFQNRRIHVNRKPNDKEAFAMAKKIIKDNLKQPQTATFHDQKFKSVIDTASNSYEISSSVNSQDSAGKTSEKNWNIKLAYKGGDWETRSSWDVIKVDISK